MPQSKGIRPETKKYYDEVWAKLKTILDNENWEKPNSDEKLSDMILAMGTFCSGCIVREVRMMHGVGAKLDRQKVLYSRQFKESK